MKENNVLKPTNDYIFKRLFSKKGNEDILKDLLEGILEIKIEEVEVMQEVELERINIRDKTGVLDIKAVIDKKTTIDIEMQIKNEYNMIERTLFYWAGLYYTGLKSSEKYKENNKVITINLLRFNIFKETNYHIVGKIKEKESNNILTDKLEVHFIELPKFLATKKGGNKKLRQWLEFICNEREEEVKMAVKENKKIAKADQEWEYLKGDEAVQRIAFLREKWERDWISNIEGAKEKGREEGKAEGKVEGKAEGKMEGKSEEKKRIALEMLKKNMEEEIIKEITQLTEEELEKIKNELKNKML